jgi:hypothetical protein
MADETTQDLSAESTPAVEAPASAPASLQLSDLVLALQTIQASVQRGAIRVEEMSTVGGLYDRLLAFLEAQGAITRQAPPQGETPNA